MKDMKSLKTILLTWILLLILSSCDAPLKANVIEQLKLDPPVAYIQPSGDTLTDGTFGTGISISFVSPDPQAEVHYILTKAGSSQVESRYSTPISVGGHGARFELTAFTRKENSLDSDKRSWNLFFDYSQIDPPQFSLVEGTYNSDQLLEISNSLQSTGADILFNISGHSDYDPSLYYSYTGPILLKGDDNSYTVNARAQAQGIPASQEISSEYTISYLPLNPPVFSPLPGTYPTAQRVNIQQDQGALIWYTLDGSDPKSSSSRSAYQGQVNLSNSDTTLRVYCQTNGFKGIERSGTYSISPEFSPSPQFSPTVDQGASGLIPESEVYSTTISGNTIRATANRNISLELTAPSLSTLGGRLYYTLFVSTDLNANPIQPLVNDDMTPVVIPGVVETLEYNGPIQITGSEIRDGNNNVLHTGNLRYSRVYISCVSKVPGYNLSAASIYELDIRYLTAPSPVIQFTGDMNSNQDQSWISTFSDLSPSLTNGLTLEYSMNGGTVWHQTPTKQVHSNLICSTGDEITYNIRLRALHTDSQILPNTTVAQLNNIIIDKKAPAAPQLSAASLYENAGTIYVNQNNQSTGTINWISLEGNTQFQYWFEGSGINSTTASNLSVSTHCTSDRDYRLYVRESDAAGNWSNPASIAFTRDTVAPSSPAMGITGLFFDNIEETHYFNISNQSTGRVSFSTASPNFLEITYNSSTIRVGTSYQFDHSHFSEGITTTMAATTIDPAGNRSIVRAARVSKDVTRPAPPGIGILSISGVLGATTPGVAIYYIGPSPSDPSAGYEFGLNITPSETNSNLIQYSTNYSPTGSPGDFFGSLTSVGGAAVSYTNFTPNIPAPGNELYIVARERDHAGNWSIDTFEELNNAPLSAEANATLAEKVLLQGP